MNRKPKESPKQERSDNRAKRPAPTKHGLTGGGISGDGTDTGAPDDAHVSDAASSGRPSQRNE